MLHMCTVPDVKEAFVRQWGAVGRAQNWRAFRGLFLDSKRRWVDGDTRNIFKYYFSKSLVHEAFKDILSLLP